MAVVGKVVSLKLRDRAAVIDEYGRLDRELTGYKPKFARLEQLRKQIQSWYDKEDAAEEFSAEGSEFTVEVGPRTIERKIISMKELKTRLGLVRFLQFAKFPLSVLDEIIPAADQSTLVTSDRTGSRRLAVVPKFSGEQAA
jgi:hypothetical protein